jgi:rhamnogalacturonan endolyase
MFIYLTFSGCSQKSKIGERMDRGLIALPKDRGVVYIGWRLLSSDPKDIKFNIYRLEIGKKEYEKINDEPISNSTNYLDKNVVPGNAYRYKLKTVLNENEVDLPGVAYVFSFPWDIPYISIPLQGEYEAQKVAIADLDGDGKYDYVIKQPDFNTDPWREKGYWKRSKEPYKLEAYSSEGKFMWRYDMGWAIETGIWYSPYIVYDLDCDGFAEIYAKAGEGDPREIDGHILEGPEYLVKIDGRTGKIIKRINWLNREKFENYNYFSRNFLTIAYLDGKFPFLIMQRGTYSIIKTIAYDKDLNQKWYWESTGMDEKFKGQGQHGIISADIDGDGRDELVIGSGVLDDDGKSLWTTGLGHPDFGYVADIDPNYPGLEIFYGIEPAHINNGICLVSAKDGKILWGYNGPTKHIHGQGMVGDIDSTNPGIECYAGESDGSKFWLYSSDGKLISEKSFGTLSPRAIWWDNDIQKEIIAESKLFKFNGDTFMEIEGNVIGIADCLGDWREEIITSINGEMRIYSTTIPSNSRRICLMQNRQYRLGVVAESMGYFYPPQIGSKILE